MSFEHPDQEHYHGQKVSVVIIDGYASCTFCGNRDRDISENNFSEPESDKKISRRQTMNDLKLDKEELDILESFERGEWRLVSDREGELERHRQYAEATLKNNRRISIRISDYDFNALRKETAGEIRS